MAEIIKLDSRRPPPNPGNGGREALIDLLTRAGVIEPPTFCDLILLELWMRGFMVGPING